MNSGSISAERLEQERKLGVWPEQVLTEFLDRHAGDTPDAPAIIAAFSDRDDIVTLTFADLHDRVAHIAQGLTNYGIVKGDVVSFQLPNWWQFVAIHLACLRVGAISNPLMPIFRHRELSFMLNNAGARLFIAPSVFRDFDHGAMALQLRDGIEALEHVLLVGGEGDHSFEKHLLEADPQDRFQSGTVLEPNDRIQLLYTSGTTGEPKGVVHTSNTILGITKVFSRRMDLGQGDVIFMPSPFAHQTGFSYGITAAMVLGIPLVTQDAWEPTLAADLIEKYRATYTFAATPFMSDLANLADIKQRDISAFRLFVTAGAPIPAPLIAAAQENLKATIVTGWGMTECGISTTTLLDGEKVLTSDGNALDGMETRIVDADGNPLPVGEEGKLEVRGSALFVDYFNRPGLYKLRDGGWFETGDLAFMDDEKFVRICGREKDIVIRGGENIPVVEIEAAIYKMPQITDAAIVAMPDPRLGERACLFATQKSAAGLSLEDVTAHLDRLNVAKQFWPERFEIIEEMPRTPTGKIQKFVLRELAKSFAPITPRTK